MTFDDILTRDGNPTEPHISVQPVWLGNAGSVGRGRGFLDIGTLSSVNQGGGYDCRTNSERR